MIDDDPPATIESLRAENRQLREFIDASKDVAVANNVLWYANECDRMRAAFRKMVDDMRKNAKVEFSLSGCEWCHEIWPKTDGESLDAVNDRARQHVYVCKSHPMKAERDAMRAECERMREQLDDICERCQERCSHYKDQR